MNENPDSEQSREIWVQDLTDRNLFYNRTLNLKLSEEALQARSSVVIKIMYDRRRDRELPFGYSWEVDDQIKIDSAEGEAVRLIFELREQGLSADKIAKQIENTPPPDGGDAWYGSQIRKILANESVYRTGTLGSDSSLHLPPILK